MLNLLINASHALQELDSDERWIMITTKYRDNQTIEINVTDSRPGIDEELLDHIFQHLITTREEGMGMGLTINRTIIEAYGGRLWAESSPEQGAALRMTLPVAQ
jgi:C4-dicarboxylate-specific signal transduction histidine kinase